MRAQESDELVAANLRRARTNLLAGRGPGASSDEVAAHTRNRVAIAGETVTRRLELAARDTVRARRDPEGLTDTIQIVSTELAGTLDRLTERLRPGRLATAAGTMVINGLRAGPARFVLTGAAVALIVRVRRRNYRPDHRTGRS